jgi:hypothetical protein
MRPLQYKMVPFGWELQLALLNKTTFTAKEFDAILNHLAKGTVFEKAKTDKTEVYKTAIDPIKMPPVCLM